MDGRDAEIRTFLSGTHLPPALNFNGYSDFSDYPFGELIFEILLYQYYYDRVVFSQCPQTLRQRYARNSRASDVASAK